MENHYEQQKEHYEMISHAFKIGYISAKNGKNIPLFEDNNVMKKDNKITKEQKQEEFAYLEQIFGE